VAWRGRPRRARPRCGRTMALAEAEGVDVARRGSDAWLGSFPQATREQAGDPVVREQSGSGAQGLRLGAAALRVAVQACRLCFCSARA
jgi:hypothetical protein